MNANSLLAQAQALLQAQNFAAAIPVLREAVKKASRDPNAWFMLGIAQGSMDDLPAAEKAFRRTVELVPGAHAAWENLGRVQMKLGQAQGAERSFRKSIGLQAANPTAHAALGELRRRTGDLEGSRQALHTALGLDPNAAAIHNQMGATLELSGEVTEAAQHYRRALELAPNFYDARFNLATALRVLGRNEDAMPLYQACINQQPGMVAAWIGLADCLLNTNHWPEALQLYRQVLQQDPRSHTAHLRIVRIMMKTPDLDAAERHLEAARALCPADDPDVCAQRAEFAILQGRFDEAREILAPALAAHPAHIPLAIAEASLAERTDPSPAAIERLEGLRDSQSLPPEDLYFVLGRLYERAGRYEEAFQAFQAAHARRGMASDLPQHLEQMERIEHFFTRQRLAQLPDAGRDDPLPVFIVGMPRSGTSLAEQILASHPGVHGAGETLKLAQVVRDLEQRTGQRYPEAVAALSAADLDALADDYLNHLRGQAPQARRICDKLPHNFLHLGLIQRLFPRATVIHCRRDPLDTCLSIFTLRFNASHRYAQNLEDLGRYYRRYEQLMAHWRQALDLNIHTLDYERLVEDQEGETRRLLAAAGLDWDDACLRFFENRRTVTTPSFDQVRRPLYRSSVQRWRRFEAQLEPLRKALQS